MQITEQQAGAQVGKVDYSPPAGKPTQQGDRAAGILPSAELGVVGWLEFWLTTVNSNLTAAPSKWAFSIRDAVALMGSHTLNAPQGCATGRDTIVRSGLPGYKNKGCRGPPRMSIWNNWYFKVRAQDARVRLGCLLPSAEPGWCMVLSHCSCLFRLQNVWPARKVTPLTGWHLKSATLTSGMCLCAGRALWQGIRADPRGDMHARTRDATGGAARLWLWCAAPLAFLCAKAGRCT